MPVESWWPATLGAWLASRFTVLEVLMKIHVEFLPTSSKAYGDSLVVKKQLHELSERELMALRLYHGMPVDAALRTVKFQGDELARAYGEKWRGWQANGIGAVAADAVPPWVRVGDETVQLYELRLGRLDCGLYIQVRWNAQVGLRTSLCGLEMRHKRADVIRMHAGLALLEKLVNQGRPRGTGTFENREAFLAVFVPAVEQLRRKGQNPTTGNVLKALRTKLGIVDKAQLTRWYQSLGWQTWRDFLNDVS